MNLARARLNPGVGRLCESAKTAILEKVFALRVKTIILQAVF
jgi:hypothetical protein